ncbi:MAG: T9SS type A sorting domain-containing protein [Flavobacteriales bacterium]|nr:T9SS type A sorting domain-containing protein [Flavobacteriales bacterium]
MNQSKLMSLLILLRRLLYGLVYFGIMIVGINRCNGQQPPSILWQNAIGGSQEDGIMGMTACPDGGYILVGTTQSTDGDLSANQGMRDYLICKLNSIGEVQWIRNYGGSSTDMAMNVLVADDGGYFIVGNSSSTNGDFTGVSYGFTDVWVLKIDASGVIEWQRNYGGTNGDTVSDALMASNGDCILVGGTSSNDGNLSGNHGDVDFWVLRIDSFGEVQWSRCYGGSAYDAAQGIIESADGGFVIGGGTLSNNGDVTGNHGGYDCWIVKVNGNGDIQWQQTFGGSGFESISDVAELTSGDIVAVGSTESLDGDVGGVAGLRDVWVVRASASGALLWQNTYGGSFDESAFTVVETEFGGYVIGGTTSSNDGDVVGSNGQRDFWLFELSDENVMLWQGCYGGSADDNGQVLLVDGVDGYCFAGTTASTDGDVVGGMGVTDAWIIKVDQQQSSISDYSMVANQLRVYPNPVLDILYVELGNYCEESTSVDVYDAQMTLVVNVGHYTSSLCEHSEIDISALNPGMYYVRVSKKDGEYYGRFIKM